MIVLSGASLVLPDRILSPGTLIIDHGRIAEIRPDTPSGSHADSHFAFHGHYIVPGFIDLHVHGVDGVDSLDRRAEGDDAIAAIAARLPRYGVVAFCPTTVACGPGPLRSVLDQVRRARETPPARAARVLPAHLESNFINPEYSGAQPSGCLRLPQAALGSRGSGGSGEAGGPGGSGESARSGGPGRSGESGMADRSLGADGSDRPDSFTGADILHEIERAAPDVGIVTLASELDGGLDLIKWLVARGHRVSLGHSGATYEQALAAIEAGARQATHLFNRMPPLGHRAPGLAGAVLQTDEVAAEIICDAFHVHPALVRTAIAAKRPSRIVAISDGTAAAGLPRGGQARLGGQAIVAGESTALLADGTIAGSILTMDRAFQTLVGRVGISLVDAATICATTPARELGLVGHGLLAAEAPADLVVLDANFSVVQTYLGGELVYARERS
jgi:N-acetylglucosamine-6-phosphate deacetylase